MVKVYSVTPGSASQTGGAGFDARLADAVSKCERADWTGMLIPQNLHEVDPWMVAGRIGAVSERLIPLVAVQPSSMPPHTAALIASAYAALHGRPLHFNLIAGARPDELQRTGDSLTHDERYDRLLEFGRVLKALLQGETVNHEGRYFVYKDFRLEPWFEVLAQCKFFVAGSSEAGIKTAMVIADVLVTHPSPYKEWRDSFLEPLLDAGYEGEFGIRIGVVSRTRSDEAWEAARSQFPATRRGTLQTAMRSRSQNVWAKELATRAIRTSETEDGAYWLGAFKTGRVSAPYFVGAHEEVAAEIGMYLNAGVGHLLLCTSTSSDDAENINAALRAARSPD